MWHNVHSLQHTYMNSSYRFSRLGLSHWDPYAVHGGGCLELYYCNMVESFCMVWFKPDLDDQLDSSSVLTLIVWSSNLYKLSPKWPVMCWAMSSSTAARVTYKTLKGKERKGKEVCLYSAILSSISKRSDMDNTVYLQITPCLPFLRKRSPDVATPTKVADI